MKEESCEKCKMVVMLKCFFVFLGKLRPLIKLNYKRVRKIASDVAGNISFKFAYLLLFIAIWSDFNYEVFVQKPNRESHLFLAHTQGRKKVLVVVVVKYTGNTNHQDKSSPQIGPSLT